MPGLLHPEVAQPKWREERLRYRVLQFVFERVGEDCDAVITGPEIGSALNLPFEDLFRAIAFLRDHEYLSHVGPGPRVCITRKGIEYLSVEARRRRSIRD